MKSQSAALLLSVIFILSAAGCAHREKKSSSRIYEGESPSIHYTAREAAGGPIGGR